MKRLIVAVMLVTLITATMGAAPLLAAPDPGGSSSGGAGAVGGAAGSTVNGGAGAAVGGAGGNALGGNGSWTVSADCSGGVAGFLGLQSWDACLRKDANGVPQFTDLNNIWPIATVVVGDIIKIAGYLAVGFIVWGGIKYLKSQGDPGETTQARQIINNALFGLIIVIISVAIVQFIAGTFS